MSAFSELQSRHRIVCLHARTAVLQRIEKLEEKIRLAMSPDPSADSKTSIRRDLFVHSYSCHEVDHLNQVLDGDIGKKMNYPRLSHVRTIGLAAKIEKAHQPTYVYRSLPCDCASKEELWYISGADAEDGTGILEWCLNENDAIQRLFLMREYPRFSNLLARKAETPEGLQTVVSLVWEHSEVHAIIEECTAQKGMFVGFSLGKPGISGKQPYRVVCMLPVPQK